MDFKIYPLSITTPSWEIFIKICQEELGFSPTRGLDDAGISLKQASAFLATLSLDNKPREALRDNVKILHHFFISFIISIEPEFLVDLYNWYYMLELLSKSTDHKDFCICSGTVHEWRDTVVMGCNKNSPKIIRQISNHIYNNLLSGGFSDIFYDFTRNNLLDDTFELKRK